MTGRAGCDHGRVVRTVPPAARRKVTSVEVLCGLLVLAVVFQPVLSALLDVPAISTGATVFVAVCLQALPFLVFGVLVSGLIAAFVPAERLRRHAPVRHDERLSDERVAEELSGRKAVAIGTAQAVALLPGFSRSGATMAGGLLAGLSNEDAARFAFLLATPTLKYKTYSSPAVVWFRDRFYLAWRRSEEWQPHVPDWDGYGRDQVDVWSWALGASSLVRVDNQSWARDMKTEEGPVMVVFRGNLYIVVVCSKDSYWVRWHKYNHSDGSWSRMPDPPIHQAYDVPSVTVYEDKLYMVIRGPPPLSVTIWDGTKWSPIMLLSIARKKCPAMALHNGELELLYLER